MPDVYYYRSQGKQFCETDGSKHYYGNVEPLDLIIARGLAKDFCLANIIKYAARYKQNPNLNDLKKIADYAHILCGIELEGQKCIISDS